MRTFLLLAAVDPDTAATLCFVAAMAVLLPGTLLSFLLPRRAPAPVWQEGERHLDPRPARWRAAHRHGARPERGRHEPGRGRYAGKARQVQLEERTVWVDRSVLLRKPGP